MATAKDFRKAISDCARSAVDQHPKQRDYEQRISYFVACLSGTLFSDEERVSKDLWNVLHPGTPYPQSVKGE